MTALLFIVSLVVWPAFALFQAAADQVTKPVPSCAEAVRTAGPAVQSSTSVGPSSFLVCGRPS
jgi:hypothetical protein